MMQPGSPPERTPTPGADAARRAQVRRMRRRHRILLGAILVAAAVLVAVKGVDRDGIMLIAVIAAVLAVRGWTYWQSRE